MANDLSDYQTINGNHGVTNTLNNAAFYTQVIETCRQINGILVDHCGPYASDALIIQNNDGRNLKDPHYAIFTKDGINIVRSIEFVSPIQKHIQGLVAYVGSRVDSLSHDGTTTAMLFFTALVIHYITRLAESLSANVPPEPQRLRREVAAVLQLITDGIEAQVVTVERLAADHGLTREAAVRYIAHHQAILSSKGDRELADAISEVVETLPPELYGLFSVQQSKIELDKRFTVLHDEFDFVMSVISNLDDMNHHLGTEYLAESCDLIVSEDSLVRGNPALGIVEDYVRRMCAGELEQDLVILAKAIDPTLHGIISTHNRAQPHKIIVFTHTTSAPYSSKIAILSAISAVASVYPLGEHVIDPTLPYLIRNAKVHFKRRRLFLSNLYPRDGSPYHPSFTDPVRFEPYTRMVADIREELDGFTSGRQLMQTPADVAMYEDYVEIYRRMISADVRNLQISGMRHDTLADKDVLQDAFGAVLSSLEHGFVFDGYLKLYHLLLNPPVRNEATDAVFNGVRDILTAIHKQDAARSRDQPHASVTSRGETHGIVNSRFPTHEAVIAFTNAFQRGNAKLSGQIPVHASDDTLFALRIEQALAQTAHAPDAARTYLYYPVGGDPTENIGTEWEAFPDGFTITPVIQPADTYRELFRRVGDLLPKLINTNRAIIPNTVNAGAAS
jgi:hypothetical protein